MKRGGNVSGLTAKVASGTGRLGSRPVSPLAVTVSEEIPGWYYALVATVPSAAGGAEAGYSHAITLKDAEEGGRP